MINVQGTIFDFFAEKLKANQQENIFPVILISIKDVDQEKVQVRFNTSIDTLNKEENIFLNNILNTVKETIKKEFQEQNIVNN